MIGAMKLLNLDGNVYIPLVQYFLIPAYTYMEWYPINTKSHWLCRFQSLQWMALITCTQPLTHDQPDIYFHTIVCLFVHIPNLLQLPKLDLTWTSKGTKMNYSPELKSFSTFIQKQRYHRLPWNPSRDFDIQENLRFGSEKEKEESFFISSPWKM